MDGRALDLFEELRFILELLTAEHLFACCFTRRRRQRFRLTAVAGALCLMLLGGSYAFWYRDCFQLLQGGGEAVFNLAWYILLSLLGVGYLHGCYRLTWADALFLCSGAYSLQHVEYVVVNEVMARGLFPEIRLQLFFYMLLCVFSTLFLYYMAYRIFAPALKKTGGGIYEDNGGNVVFTGMFYALVFLSTFLCQALFIGASYDYESVNYKGAAVDFLICALILWAQYGKFILPLAFGQPRESHRRAVVVRTQAAV